MVFMVNEEIVGTDIDVEWILDREGDLSLTNGRSNLAQGLYLRLTAYFNSMKWCYVDYGSYMKDWFGKPQTPYTRNTLLREVYDKVMEDPRVEAAEVEIVDWTASYIGLKITAYVENQSFQEYFIFSDLPRQNQDVRHSDYKDTHIDTKLNGYYGIPGQSIKVHCHVLDKENKRVPIGKVTMTIGNHYMETIGSDNPQEISYNGTEEPGSVSFEFIIPKFFEIGEHDLTFHYHGINGYNPSSTTTTLHIVDRIPTSTHFIYPRPKYQYYYANDVDDFTDSMVYVVDANEELVDHGEVRYYLDETDMSGDYVFIDFPIIFLDDVMLNETVFIKCRNDLINCSNNFVFKLSRMFHMHDIITLRCANGKVIDFLEVNYVRGVYTLTTVDLIFGDDVVKEDHNHPNCDIRLDVME